MRIIGVGSPFGVDNFGWKVVEELQKQQLPKDIELIQLDRPGPAIIDYFDTESVLIVDAMITDGPCGKVYMLGIDDIQQEKSRFSTHEYSLSQTVRLASELDALPQKIHFVGINFSGFDSNEIPIEYIQNTIEKITQLLRPY